MVNDMLNLLNLLSIVLCFVIGANLGYLVSQIFHSANSSAFVLLGGVAVCFLSKQVYSHVSRIPCSDQIKIIVMALLTLLLSLVVIQKIF